uniref:CARDB domain-containing protein n=2 Tax=environmental samples TaxID=68359 RepID=A0A075GQ66_9EURY|nr:hypothetical protein [uncultured marine group II/III euryarchaeote KM3_18_H05]AIF06392.1 hypothetical protein [uncultured marine group II/III euryarchaeote KM3_191_F05]
MRAHVACAVALLFLLSLFSPYGGVGTAEPDYGSGQFHELGLYFYGDLDGGSGNFNTTAPTSDSDTESDCPQGGNRLGVTGNRNWENVGSWFSPAFNTNATARGTVPFEIWAMATSGSVKDVQFRATLVVPGAGFLQSETETRTVNDNASHFSTSFSLDAEYQIDRDQTIRVDLEYSGGDDWQPIGGSSDQIVILTSSQNHSAGIALELDHFRAEFPRIEVDHAREVVEVEARLLSAFGSEDLQLEAWGLEVRGTSSGTHVTVPEGTLEDSNDESLLVKWEWAYNEDEAPSDTYYLTVSCGDIQDNEWESSGDERLYLVVHQSDIDNYVGWEDVSINGATNSTTVVTGKQFAVAITIRAAGDPAIGYNPVPVVVYYSHNNGPLVLAHDTFTFVTPGESSVVSFALAFDSPGSYTLHIILDEDNHALETDEDNNMVEYSLTVADEDSGLVSGTWFEGLQDLDTTTLGIGGVAVLVILGVVVALRRSSRGDDMEWDDDDEF